MRAHHGAITILPWLITVVSGGCAWSRFSGQIEQLERLTLQRSVCFGTCPEYAVTVEANGQVVFEGGRFVAISKGGGHVSPTDWKALINALNEERFLSLKDQYETKADGCDDVVTDHPTVTISADFDGKSKTVRHYHGCWKDSPTPPAARTMPPEPPGRWRAAPSPPEPGCPYPMGLVELENRIDAILGTERWTGKLAPQYSSRCFTQPNRR